MFCPNCGNNCGDANFCPNCGCNLKGTVITVSTSDNVPDERAEMIRRYEKYMPNKLAAIKALREDTGMGLKDAKDVIDGLFDSETSGQARCPRCQSTSISANRRGYSIVWGVIGANKVICTCLKCGHRWKPGKK